MNKHNHATVVETAIPLLHFHADEELDARIGRIDLVILFYNALRHQWRREAISQNADQNPRAVISEPHRLVSFTHYILLRRHNYHTAAILPAYRNARQNIAPHAAQ